MPAPLHATTSRPLVGPALLLAMAAACGTSPDPDDGPGSTGEDGDPPALPEAMAVPDDVDYCDPVREWRASWSQQERELLELVNEIRAQGADCGSEGEFGPAEPLTMDPHLRCSARVHSLDMVENDFFDHDNLDGESPFQRMRKAGYDGNHMAENIASGHRDIRDTLDQWLVSDGHCSAIMHPNFEHIGIGHRPGGSLQYVWTQNFGAEHPPEDDLHSR